MMELEKADELVNAAYRRVQDLNRFSRFSAPIGKAELAIIALQALAELGALADWTVGPGITHSIVQLLDDNERQKFEKFREFVQGAGTGARVSAEQASLTSDISSDAEMEIDPAPSSHSHKATQEEVFGDEDLGARAAEAIVYQLYYEMVERAAILVERSAAAQARLWPLVWVVATLIPPPDLSLRRPLEAPDGSGS
jgi:hypothetical protein